jgi:hypothetical protein
VMPPTNPHASPDASTSTVRAAIAPTAPSGTTPPDPTAWPGATAP